MLSINETIRLDVRCLVAGLSRDVSWAGMHSVRGCRRTDRRPPSLARGAGDEPRAESTATFAIRYDDDEANGSEHKILLVVKASVK